MQASVRTRSRTSVPISLSLGSSPAFLRTNGRLTSGAQNGKRSREMLISRQEPVTRSARVARRDSIYKARVGGEGEGGVGREGGLAERGH